MVQQKIKIKINSIVPWSIFLFDGTKKKLISLFGESFIFLFVYKIIFI